MENIREALIKHMSELENKGVNCFSCTSAECCTFVKNSMMITPLETVELIKYLYINNRVNDSLLAKLHLTIKDYRLDSELPSNGKRLFSRRSYTCPFLEVGAKACSISRGSKPYGCLAYNATVAGSVVSDTCQSDQGSLEAINLKFKNILADKNDSLRNDLNVEFDKLSIPCAILKVLESNELSYIMSLNN
jgi:Fe-S-cluster containining protein